MTSNQLNKKIDKLVSDYIKRPKTKVEIERNHEALRRLQGLWADNPRTEKDLRRIRKVIWG